MNKYIKKIFFIIFSLYLLYLLLNEYYYKNKIIEPVVFTSKYMIDGYKKHNIIYNFKNKTLCKNNKVISYKNNLNPISSNCNCIKNITSSKLMNNNIPVPKFYVWDTSKSIDNNIFNIKKNLSFPLVMKPTNGTQGKNVFVNIDNENEIRKISINLLKLYNNKKIQNIMVEEQVFGDNFRILVLNNKIIGIVKRVEPYVIGNGKLRLQDLIKIYNNKQIKNKNHPVSNITLNIIHNQGYNLNSIIPINKKVIISNTVNYHNGSNIENINISNVHPKNIEMFLRISKILNLKLCGIDYMTKSLNIPYTKDGHIIEVNNYPDLYVHKIVDEKIVDNFMKNLL